jgi:hypothetical protein
MCHNIATDEATGSNRLQKIKIKVSNEKRIVKTTFNAKPDGTKVLGQLENFFGRHSACI